MKDINILNVSSKSEGKDTCNLIIEGDLVIETLHKAKLGIKNILEKYDKVNLELNNIDNIDLAGLQFLSSLIKTFKTLDKSIKIELQLLPDMKGLIEHSGFIKIKELSLS